MTNQTILVLDFGGQYKQLIASGVRRHSVYSEIRSGNLSAAQIKEIAPIGIILTGGPDSVYLPEAPKIDTQIFELGIPILGICYGMHLMCQSLGGVVSQGIKGEYGVTAVAPTGTKSLLFDGKSKFDALMSHRDAVKKIPNGFVETAKTENCTAAFENESKGLYGVQFHPETKHTKGGDIILANFLFKVCKAKADYKLSDYIETQVKKIREKVGDKRVILGLSGGVDSSVCAALLSKAIPNQLFCVFVDHGFMRLNEGDEIESVFSKRDLHFIRVNAKDRFLAKLKGVVDPEEKRKIIGGEFVSVFQDEAKKLGGVAFLAQGTIYPDIVESGGKHGATIKSHHNVGGLPKDMVLGIVEPLSGLFKDEVRTLGQKLGLPSSLVHRQPFPGPGLAIRIIGEVTDKKLEVLQKADAIVRENFDKLKARPSQYFAVLTDTNSVGVKGDDRTYDPVIAVRAVVTDDFMTCSYAEIPHKVLSKVASTITSEISSVSRVVYDITSKPPATVEWE